MIKEKCKKCGRRVPVLTFAGNIGLSAVKIIGGILSNSVGLTVDGFHSLTDALASIFVLISLRISEKPSDDGHPYGHGKVEFIASLAIYIVLFWVGIVFLVESLIILLGGVVTVPHAFAALIAMVSILTNYMMMNLNRCAGKKLNSPALTANGDENFTDLCSSIPVLIGIIAAQFGLVFCDPLAGLLVAFMIIHRAGKMCWENLQNLMDKGVSVQTLRKIRAIAKSVKGVKETKNINTRSLGQNLWIDLHVLVDAGLNVKSASCIADEVRTRLLQKGKYLDDVIVYFSVD